MLKTDRGQKVWLITQPAHAELAGQMASHWGNQEFGDVPLAADLRES